MLSSVSGGVVASSSGSENELVSFGSVDAWARRKRGRPHLSHADKVSKDGPALMVFLIGQSGGRWASEIYGSAQPCRKLGQLLQATSTSQAIVGEEAHAAAGEDVIVGMAILTSWRFVQDQASHAHTYAMIKASLAGHPRRKGQRFLEHEVLASAELQASFTLPPGWAFRSPRILGCEMAGLLAKSNGQFVVNKGSLCDQVVSLDRLLSAWRAERPLVEGGAIFPWPATLSLASALAKGQWWGDVSVRHRRREASARPELPGQPSLGVMRYFLKQEIQEIKPPPISGQFAQAPTAWLARKGFVRAYNPEHSVASLRIALEAKNMASAERCMQRALMFSQPQTWRQVVVSLRGERPLLGKKSHCRALVSFDIASMLARREAYKRSGPTFRYLAFDASPQRGVEFFITVERVVLRSALEGLADTAWPAVEQRMLPPATLGHGRMRLHDKAQAHVHQVWLDYGPTVSDVRKANLDVRQCLSDMGVELGIADAKDTLPEFLGEASVEEASVAYLYPLAIVVPGPQHIIDSVLQHALAALPGWPAWQEKAKVMCQWLASATHREFLVSRVTAMGGEPDVVSKRVRSLGSSIDRFASWRWKTLAKVTEGLERVSDAVRVGMASGTASDLGSRDASVASAVWQAACDDDFWWMASALRQLIAPLASFSSWVRGCRCHEADRLAGRKVSCPWQGCRAPELASRVHAVFAELQALRVDFTGQLECVTVVSQMLSLIQLKLAWVFEEPYLVWQVSSLFSVLCVLSERLNLLGVIILQPFNWKQN